MPPRHAETALAILRSPNKPEGLLAAPPEQRLLAPLDVVSFKNVSKTFGKGAEAKVALQDISFTIEDLPHTGELITIVGPSGCGKSTVLRIIAGLKPHFPPTSGEVLVLGKPVTGTGAGPWPGGPEILAPAAPERARKYRLRPEAARREPLGAAGPGAGMGEEGRPGRVRRRNILRSFPAGCSSGWPLRPRSFSSRASC